MQLLRAGHVLYELACEGDLDGIVVQWARGTYQCEGRGTSWLKIKNPKYSQAKGRHELFERRDKWVRRRNKAVAPTLSLP